jgi:methyltransferase (TIGR00027 family)
MALFRAIESSGTPESRLFSDPYAALFLNGWRKWVYQAARFDAGRRLIERLLDRNSPGARAAGIARTQWIDAEVARALQESTQLVLLGAGFDTRAYRLPAAHRVRTFELDRPETSLLKQAILRKKMGSLPKQVKFVTIDFNKQSVSDALHAADFDISRRTCFVWEGVSNYLSVEAVDDVLRQISKAAAGSVLLFTYIDRRVLDRPDEFLGAQKLLRRLRSYGEPWTFGLDREEIGAYLSDRHLRLLNDVGVADIWQRASRPADEVRGYEFYRIASAAVPRADSQTQAQ